MIAGLGCLLWCLGACSSVFCRGTGGDTGSCSAAKVPRPLADNLCYERQPGQNGLAWGNGLVGGWTPFEALEGVDPAPHGRFPWIVSITSARPALLPRWCTGVLVHPQFVLTAAHCVDSHSPESVGKFPVMSIGAYGVDDDPRMEGGSRAMRAVRIYVHPKWNGSVKRGFDVALVKLPEPVCFTDPECPILLLPQPGSTLKEGRALYSLGWGVLGSDLPSPVLQFFSSLRVLDSEYCQEGEGVASRVLCLATEAEERYGGDPGGPVFMADMPKLDLERGDAKLDVLVGITSKGVGYGQAKRQGLHLRLEAFIDWMDAVMSMEDRGTLGYGSLGHPFGGRWHPVGNPWSNLDNASKGRMVVDLLCGMLVWITFTIYTMGRRKDASAAFLEYDPSAEPLLSLATKQWLEKNMLGLASSNRDDQTLLHLAALEGELEAVKVLLYWGKDIDAKDGFAVTPIQCAVANGRLSIVKVLLSAGADITGRDDYGQGIMHMAATNGTASVVKLLLEHGGDARILNSYGQTARDVSEKLKTIFDRYAE